MAFRCFLPTRQSKGGKRVDLREEINRAVSDADVALLADMLRAVLRETRDLGIRAEAYEQMAQDHLARKTDVFSRSAALLKSCVEVIETAIADVLKLRTRDDGSGSN